MQELPGKPGRENMNKDDMECLIAICITKKHTCPTDGFEHGWDDAIDEIIKELNWQKENGEDE
jgi:hypothetical protein